MTEYMDIYDAEGNATGVVLERGTFLKEGQYQLYVTGIVKDMQGRYLITQRSMNKRWAAGWWEVSGGGAHAGETAEQAVLREASEEVGLSMEGVQPEFVSSYCNTDLDRGDNYLMYIYLLPVDFSLEDVKIQEEEAIDCRLVTWEEIKELDAQGIFLHFTRIRDALDARDERMA